MVMPDGTVVDAEQRPPTRPRRRDPVVGFDPNDGIVRDTYWPRSAAGWLVLSVILVLLSVNLVSPTRRWRPRLAAVAAGTVASPSDARSARTPHVDDGSPPPEA